MSTVQFSPQLLNSYEGLHDFIFGEQVEQKVERQVLEAKDAPNWRDRWTVAIVKEVVYAVASVYFEAIGALLYYAGCVRWGLNLDLKAKVYLHYSPLGGDRLFGADFLVPAMNIYSEEALDLYVQEPLEVEKIQSEEVRAILHPNLEVIKFQKNDGMCLGVSRWFIRTYFKTKHLFDDPKKHLEAIGRLFMWGAPVEPALLQKLCPIHEYAGLAVAEEENVKLNPESDNPKDNINKVAESIRNLQPGAYLIGVPYHALVYICFAEGEGVFFDPNLGTAYIHDESSREKMAKQLVIYRPEKDDKIHKEWLVEFEKVTLI